MTSESEIAQKVRHLQTRLFYLRRFKEFLYISAILFFIFVMAYKYWYIPKYNKADILINQLRSCWEMPESMPNTDAPIIDVVVNLNTDASIHDITLIDTGNRYQNDRNYTDMADSVISTLKNPLCKPLKLPLDKYQEWHSMQLRFDPKEMLNP
jgi:hypothetical protein